MPAKDKAGLLAVSRKEYDRLETLITSVGEETALVKDNDDTSIKDVVAHRAHWIGLFLGWNADGMAGKTVYFPAEGYKWNDLRRYNADLRAPQAGMGWADAVAALRGQYDELTAFLERHSDDELYGQPMQGAKNDWAPGRWAEAVGPSHFRSASKYIRSRLKS